MGAKRGASVGVAVVVLALFVVGSASSSGSIPASAVRSASAQKLVSFFRPTGDTLVEKNTGPIRVIVQLGEGARLTEVDVDGVDVTRRLQRGPGGLYGALLKFGPHLHYGVNDAFAQAVGRNGVRATAHVRFIVAKRDDSLLHLTSFSTRTAAAPLQLGLREAPGTNVRAALSAAQGVSARVYVNDRRVDRALSLQGGRLTVRLGAGEGLRFGRNLIQILVHKTHPYKRQSSYDMESRVVYIARDAPIASAGADQTTTQGDLVKLDGKATKLPPGWTRSSFRWKIVSAPPGSRAKLRNASSSLPTLVPHRAGVYAVRVSVRATRPGRRTRLGAPDVRQAGAASATLTDASNDTATVTVMPDVPPFGVRLDTLALGRDDSVVLGGTEVSGTPFRSTGINYVVLDRQTLRVAESGSVDASVAGMKDLAGIVDGYTGSLDYLVVLNWAYFGDDIGAERDAFGSLLQKIGADKLTEPQRQEITAPGSQSESGSAVGIAGAPAGSAFVKFSGPDNYQEIGGMSGYLRLNGVTGKYDFVFTDPVGFDTETNQTSTDNSPAQLTVKVGDTTHTRPNPGGGVSGFHLVVLSAKTLTPVSNNVYATNAADGTEQPEEVQRLAGGLTYAAFSPKRPLAILQAFGAPHGNDGAWDLVAQQVERLGGTRQVFDAMNTSDPRALNGEDAHRKGPYAFVGRVGSTAPLAEASYSLDGLPGRLRGVLMRGRDGEYEPMAAGPPRKDGQSPVNTELIQITNQAPRPFPPFKDAEGKPIAAAQAEEVEKFLGGPDVTGLCSAAAPVCDIRKSYYESYDANWASYQDDLTNATAKCREPHEGFTASQCEGIRAELRDEVSMVAKVTQYFGPDGLQEPFGASDVAALANLTDIAQEIKDAVQPPPADNTTSNFLTAISYLLNSAQFYPGPGTTAAGVAGVLYAAFAVGGYFTHDNGSPDLIGPQVTTAASKLGVELTNRYQQAGDNLDNLGRLVVSDYGKLTAVASKVNARPGPGEFDWRLGSVGRIRDALIRGAKQTIYERLVPLVYPEMYQLGGWNNAREWWCYTTIFQPDRYMFRDQADSAQFIGRFEGGTTTVAVAKRHYEESGSDARVPGVPGSIADQLFKPIAAGGLGLSKLQFYSPRNGFRYVSLDKLRGASGIAPFCAELPDPPGTGSG